jgi:nitrogen PTS system EIIA component
MDLKIKDIVEQLQVSEKTVYRWIKEKKIPCYRINHQYRFNKSEINEWILSNRIELSGSLINLGFNTSNLSTLIERGGIITDVEGENVNQILTSAIDKVLTPSGISKKEILSALLSREELMPTAIGKGIAIPHPRSPIVTDPNRASVSICYLSKPVDFKSLDGEPVHTLFVLLTSTPKMHLDVLAKVSHLCQSAFFLLMMEGRSALGSILDYVRIKEKEWQKKEN